MVGVGLGEIAALLGVLVSIELAQLGILGSTYLRSRHNERRLDVLLRSLGFDPDDLPTYDGLQEPREPRRADGGDERDP